MFLFSFCFINSPKVAEEKIRYAAYNCVAIDTDVSPWEEWTAVIKIEKNDALTLSLLLIIEKFLVDSWWKSSGLPLL